MAKKRKYIDEIPPSTSDEKETLAQYQARRAAEEQEEYFWKGSRNRNEAYKLIEYVSDEKRKDARSSMEYWLNDMNRASDAYARTHNIDPALAAVELSRIPYSDIDNIEDRNVINYLNARDYMQVWYNKAMGIDEYLPTCIATATSNHPYKDHFVTGNQTFIANPGRYGWKRVGLKDIKRGSLIQHLNSDNIPVHAVIIDSISPKGDRFVNYAPFKYPEYKKHKFDWKTENEELYYNFVGNSADSLRWENEYNNLYGIKKRLGGSVRSSLKDYGICIKL